jgi:hypothetical protein
VVLARPDGFTNEDNRRTNDVTRDQAFLEIQEMVAAGVVTRPSLPGAEPTESRPICSKQRAFF